MSEQNNDQKNTRGAVSTDWDALSSVESSHTDGLSQIPETEPNHEPNRDWSDVLAEMNNADEKMLDEAIRQTIAKRIYDTSRQAASNKMREIVSSLDTLGKMAFVEKFFKDRGISAPNNPSSNEIDNSTLLTLMERDYWERFYESGQMDVQVNSILSKLSDEAREKLRQENQSVVFARKQTMKS